MPVPLETEPPATAGWHVHDRWVDFAGRGVGGESVGDSWGGRSVHGGHMECLSIARLSDDPKDLVGGICRMASAERTKMECGGVVLIGDSDWGTQGAGAQGPRRLCCR